MDRQEIYKFLLVAFHLLKPPYFHLFNHRHTFKVYHQTDEFSTNRSYLLISIQLSCNLQIISTNSSGFSKATPHIILYNLLP